MILDIITHAEDELYEENLLIVKDAYICLTSIVTVGGDKGRSAFINNRGIHSLCEVITKQTFQFEDATGMIRIYAKKLKIFTRYFVTFLKRSRTCKNMKLFNEGQSNQIK